MFERYHPLGAEIIPEKTPDEFKITKALARNTATKSHAALVIEYICSVKNGAIFTFNDIMAATGLTKKQIEKVLENHPELREILKQWVTDKRRTYKKPDYGTGSIFSEQIK